MKAGDDARGLGHTDRKRARLTEVTIRVVVVDEVFILPEKAKDENARGQVRAD